MRPQKYYVGLIDILGSKEQIRTDLVGYAVRFHQFLALVREGVRSILPQVSTHAELEIRAFQDTIIMSWPHRAVDPNDEYGDLSSIAFLIAFMIANGLERALPLRGAISAGDILRTPEGVFGTCIQEAQQLHDGSNWIGAAFANSLGRSLEESPAFKKIQQFAQSFPNHIRGALGPLVEYDVPVKPESKLQHEKRWVVDWPLYMGQQILMNAQAGDPKRLVKDRYETALSRLPRPDQRAQIKQENTQRFIEFSLQGDAIPKEKQQLLEMVRKIRQGADEK